MHLIMSDNDHERSEVPRLVLHVLCWGERGGEKEGEGERAREREGERERESERETERERERWMFYFSCLAASERA